MNDQLSSLESFDSGSNYKFGSKMEKVSTPRSLFDLSHLNTLTITGCGAIIPIACFETLPGDDHDISVDALLRVLPQVVPLYSRQRLYVYGFYSRYADLWNHWQVFMDKGYTGNVDKKIPILSDSYNLYFAENDTIKPDSLADFLGLPIGADCSKMFGHADGYSAGISALPFMMYLRIYRDYFMNKNHWINDRVMLPDDDSRFRLDDNGQLLSALDESKNFKFAPQYAFNDSTNFKDLSIEDDVYYFSGCFHDYPDDYFISALPFTQRGTTPTLNKEISGLQLKINHDDTHFPDIFAVSNESISGHYGYLAYSDLSDEARILLMPETNGNLAYKMDRHLASELEQNSKIVSSNSSLSITLEELRKLAIEQIELERLARTDGSYKQFGLTFFGESSRAAYDFRPTYIGGTYKNIAFTEVLQTSGSTVPTTAESGNTPLGTYAGHGITGISQGRIGHIHCDDYGMIMLLACIMPDVYYSQGLERIFTDSLQSEKYLPDRALLGMQPIYNKELYYAGNNGNEQGEDNYLWAYQNPYDYLRYIPNKIHGKIADMNNKTFRPYTQSRNFNHLVNWGRNFSSTKNCRTDYLFAPTEDNYTAQFSINIRSVRPLPYKAIPAEFIH